jgi:hypothetical protein
MPKAHSLYSDLNDIPDRHGRPVHHPRIQHFPVPDAAIPADIVLYPTADVYRGSRQEKSALHRLEEKSDLRKLFSIAPLIFLADFMRKSALTNITCVAFLSVTITHGTDPGISNFAFNRILDTLIGVFVSFFINIIPIGHQEKSNSREEDIHVD